MLLFILFISVLGARRNCDATGKTPIVDIFLTVWLGIFSTSALKWRETPRCGSMESVYIPRKNIQDSENTTHDLAQLSSFLQFVIWPHEAMANPARATWCTDMLISQPWQINIGKSQLILYLDIINHIRLKNENSFQSFDGRKWAKKRVDAQYFLLKFQVPTNFRSDFPKWRWQGLLQKYHHLPLINSPFLCY